MPAAVIASAPVLARRERNGFGTRATSRARAKGPSRIGPDPRALEFDRAAAFGQHLLIPASTALRFEPGDEREVKLVPYGGKRAVYGFNNLVDGPTAGKSAATLKTKAVAAAAKRKFRSSGAKG